MHYLFFQSRFELQQRNERATCDSGVAGYQRLQTQRLAVLFSIHFSAFYNIT